MKRMTVTLIALGLALAIPSLALAEEDDGPGGPPHGKAAMQKFRAIRIAELQEALNLDDKTMLKLNEILKKNDEKRDAIHKEARAQMKELKGLMDAAKPDESRITTVLEKLGAARSEMQKLQADQMGEAKKLLTPIQQAKFVLHMDKFRRHMREMLRKSWMHHGQGPGPGGPAMGPGGPGVGLGMGPGMGPGPEGPGMPPPPDDDEDF